MLTNTVIYLLFISVISLLRFRTKLDKFVVYVTPFACLYIFYLFCLDWISGSESVTSLIWDSSKSGDIKIDIISNPANYRLIFPFFIITLITLFNNLFFRFEDKKRIFSAILTLNLLSLIMLICTNNLVEIITFVFIIDILSQVLIKDVYASRRYSIYNLIADMGLFLIMAMLKGKLETLEISNISHYYETGRHRDFIMFVIMISLFIKFGFFLFQSYLLDLKNTKFHRLVLIQYLSTPMVALILLMKFYPLLVVSPSFDLCLNIALGLTMFWGTIGTIVINNLKEKNIYLNMIIISLIVKLLHSVDFIWNMDLSFMLILGFTFNICLYYIHYYLGRENNILSVTNSNQSGLKIVTTTYLISGIAFFSEVPLITNDTNLIWIYTFMILFTLASAHIFSQVLFLTNKQSNEFDFYPLVTLLICIISDILIINLHPNWLYIFSFAFSFLILIKLYPLKGVVSNASLNSKLQKIDFFSHIYDILIVQPVKIAGRWLTVLFDFMFIEKTITTMFSSLNGLTIRLFRKSARHWGVYYIFNIVLAVFIVLLCFFKEIK